MSNARNLADRAHGLTQDLDTTDSPTFAGATVSGSITVTGTVDGRDIAANIPSSLGTAGQVLTVNSGATAGEWADIETGGPSFTATAKGAISNGDLVSLQTDGKVATTTGLSDTTGVGTTRAFDSGATGQQSYSFDPDQNRLCIAFVDTGHSNRGKVSTLYLTGSGTSREYQQQNQGTFDTTSTTMSALASCYDTTNSKTVIVYTKGSDNYGVVGNLSSPSSAMTFGTAVEFDTSIAALYLDICHDSGNNRVVAVYRGSAGKPTAIVGTVSGTTLTWGTPVTIENTSCAWTRCAYDETNGKVIIAYMDDSNTYDKGRAVVGTVSGTSISFGTIVDLPRNTRRQRYIDLDYDPTSGKMVVATEDGQFNWQMGFVGTVSGTSISFGATSWLNTSNNAGQNIVTRQTFSGEVNCMAQAAGYVKGVTVSGTTLSATSSIAPIYPHAQSEGAFDSVSGVTAYAYFNNGVRPAFNTYDISNTDEWIGVADADYADGATATVQLVGSVDDAQSGLTTGSKYYLQTDATLGTTAGTPEIYVGTALSSTKILIKG